MYSENNIILIYIECHPMPVTASNGFPCLEKTLEEHRQIRFSWLPIFTIPRNFWKALIQIVYLILGLQHFGSSLLDPMLYFMCSTVHTNEFLDVTAMLLVCEDCLWFSFRRKMHFLSDSLTVSCLLPLGLRFRSAAWRALVCWKRFAWTEVFFMSHHAWCSVPQVNPKP